MHGTIFEPSRATKVIGDYDICVVGGSATGVFAAVRAARLGARVAIIENNGFFGGVATAGLVNVWHSIYDTTGERQIIGGLTEEVIERLVSCNAAIIDKTNLTRYCVFHPKVLKIILDQLVMENKIQPYLHTKFVAAYMEDNRVQAVIVEDKTGRRAIRASYFIDATGDGDVVDRLGLQYTLNPHPQPPTTCVILSGLHEVHQRDPDFDLNKCVFDPSFPDSLSQGYLWSAPVPNAGDNTMVAGTRIYGVNCVDAEDLTKAEMLGRAQAWQISEIVRKRALADNTAIPMVSLPARIGVRESRHVVCHYRLTEEDVLLGRRFPDAIGNGSFPVEIHHADKPGTTFRYLDGTEIVVGPDGSQDRGRWAGDGQRLNTFYQIPYRCLVPLNVDNLLVAGRQISADSAAFGAIRVMVNCNQTGEAAGVAAFVALDSSQPTHSVEPEVLRKKLADGGSIVF
jgi:hypothetical protein